MSKLYVRQGNKTVSGRVVKEGKVTEYKSENTVIKKKVKTKNGEPASVSFRLGATLATRPYESIRIDVGVTLPCEKEKDKVKQALVESKLIVENFLCQEISRVRANSGVFENE